jgi:hypothetical protein
MLWKSGYQNDGYDEQTLFFDEIWLRTVTAIAYRPLLDAHE